MPEKNTTCNHYGMDDCEVDVQKTFSAVDTSQEGGIGVTVCNKTCMFTKSAKSSGFVNICDSASITSVNDALCSNINELDDLSAGPCDTFSSSDFEDKQCLIYHKVTNNDEQSLESNDHLSLISAHSFHSDCYPFSEFTGETAIQHSDDVSDIYSSPCSSLHSLCGSSVSQAGKSRRFGRRFESSIIADCLCESTYLKCNHSEGIRQLSEPALLKYSDESISPELLRVDSLPTLGSSFNFLENELTSEDVSNEGDGDETCEINKEPIVIPKKKDQSCVLPPGENNRDAYLGANLCFDYLNLGICKRQLSGGVCHFRHLDPNHPDVIANRYFNNMLSEREIQKYRLRPCEENECNPFAPKDARICFDYLNKRVCSRNATMRICRYRHLLPNHPEAIADRNRKK